MEKEKCTYIKFLLKQKKGKAKWNKIFNLFFFLPFVDTVAIFIFLCDYVRFLKNKNNKYKMKAN